MSDATTLDGSRPFEFQADVAMAPEELQKEFEKRNPWHWRFVINGRAYGGKHDVDDGQVRKFLAHFPNPQTILELGCQEGAHSFLMDMHPSVKRLVALEGREASLERARLVQRVLKATKIEFVTANLEGFDLTTLGHFDVVFCAGLLYHLPKPWELLGQIARVSGSLYLSTHYADENDGDALENGYRGSWFREGGLADVHSGMSAVSFWPSLGSLVKMLYAHGFRHLRVVEDIPSFRHGPLIQLAASIP